MFAEFQKSLQKVSAIRRVVSYVVFKKGIKKIRNSSNTVEKRDFEAKFPASRQTMTQIWY